MGFFDFLGVGGESKTRITQKVLSEIVTNVCMKQVTNCSSRVSNQFTLSLKNVSGNVLLKDLSVDQFATLNGTCLQENIMKASLAEEVAAAIMTEITESGILLPLTKTQTEVETEVRNIVQTTLDLQTLSDCTMAAANDVSVPLEDISGSVTIEGFHVEQTAVGVTQCIQASQMIADIVQQLDSRVFTDVEKKGLGLDLLGLDARALLIVGAATVAIVILLK